MDWNDEERAHLDVLWNKKRLSASGCARELPGRSRDAVLSQVLAMRRAGHAMRDPKMAPSVRKTRPAAVSIGDTSAQGPFLFRKLRPPSNLAPVGVRPFTFHRGDRTPSRAVAPASEGARNAGSIQSGGASPFAPPNITDIEKLEPHHCRFVLGDPALGLGRFAWCGRRVMRAGLSWCEAHYRYLRGLVRGGEVDGR